MDKWKIADPVPAHLLIKYPEPLRSMLYARGLNAEVDAEKFLNPEYEQLLDPFLFKDMERAVVRIFEAIESNEQIVVYSDYDCDGIPAAVILSDLFKKIDYKNVRFYIPDRHDEGYGLHRDAIEEFLQSGVKLLITLDLGTTAVEEVALAQANGLDIIITDHHLPRRSPSEGGFATLDLPRAFAILNPHLEECGYPEAVLSGAGVSFKLAQAFVQKYGEYFKIQKGWEKWLLDMASLGTLSDMVPITGENRVITYFGMTVLRKNRRPGLRALFSALRMEAENITEDDITFMIAPRINAASRMDSPMRAFELLSSETPEVAEKLAEHLSKINDDRKTMVARIMKEAKRSISKRENSPNVLVIGNTGWRAGILGLVAGKLTDEFKIPSFVWGVEEDEEVIKGSCRSDGTVNVVELMSSASKHLVSYGGHAMAGGFVVTRDKVHFLEEALSLAYESVKIKSEIKTETALGVLSLSSVAKREIETINQLAPFGLQNPKPIFLFQNVKVVGIKQFGKESEHLELSLEDASGRSTAMAFFKKPEDYASMPKEGTNINLLGTLEMSYFGGRSKARIRIVDIIS